MNNRTGKYLVIVALLIGVVGLSIGFATFSTLLTISSNINVTPDDKFFKVEFSSSATELSTNQITPEKSDSKIVASKANINNADDPTITNLQATFTEPGQYVTYNFYAHNSGKYLAYLNEVNFKTITGSTLTKKCTPLVATNNDSVQTVCGDIELSVSVNGTNYNSTNNNIANHSLGKGDSDLVSVKIMYKNNNHFADGDFEVTFGDITLDYGQFD